jgi:pentatricopeptide repeat protein
MDSKQVDQARFNALSLLIKLDRLSEAEEMYHELLEKGKNKQLQKEAKTMFANVRKTAGGGN